MKKQLVSNSTHSNILRIGFAIVLFFNLSNAFAHQPVKEEEPYVAIKYIGSVDERAQFQFDFISDADENSLLTIQEEDGTVLYKEKISKKTFTKKFEWNNLDINSTKLIFSVTGEKSKKTQVFQVNTQVRTVHDVVINKM